MSVNKIVYGTTVLVDLTSDTVAADSLIVGETAHDKTGNQITGTLAVQNYYTGSAEPDASIGNDGDVYLKIGA